MCVRAPPEPACSLSLHRHPRHPPASTGMQPAVWESERESSPSVLHRPCGTSMPGRCCPSLPVLQRGRFSCGSTSSQWRTWKRLPAATTCTLSGKQEYRADWGRLGHAGEAGWRRNSRPPRLRQTQGRPARSTGPRLHSGHHTALAEVQLQIIQRFGAPCGHVQHMACVSDAPDQRACIMHMERLLHLGSLAALFNVTRLVGYVRRLCCCLDRLCGGRHRCRGLHMHRHNQCHTPAVGPALLRRGPRCAIRMQRSCSGTCAVVQCRAHAQAWRGCSCK
jgi:hypothetical protein